MVPLFGGFGFFWPWKMTTPPRPPHTGDGSNLQFRSLPRELRGPERSMASKKALKMSLGVIQ